MERTLDIFDKSAMAISGALMLLGVVILGFIEVLDGPPYGAAPELNDAGQVIASPLIDPNLRTGLVIAGLVILLLWGLYRIAQPTLDRGESPSATMSTDD